MSMPMLAFRSSARLCRRWIVALLLAVALLGLPVLSAGPLSPLLAQPAYAGCPIGGSCG